MSRSQIILRRFGLPPRLDLFNANTPVHPLRDLSAQRWPDGERTIWMKRDDETGSATSGNKIRKLAYVLAHGLEQEIDCVITSGRLQSNHCRATALAARSLGLNVHLLLAGPPPKTAHGNFFLSILAGAEVTWLDESQFADIAPVIAAKMQTLRSQGRRPLEIPMGASNACGALGYIECAYEIAQAQTRLDVEFDCIVCTLGSGGTSAGLELGLRQAGIKAPLYSINMCDSAELFRPVIARIARECSDTYNLNTSVPESEIRILDGHVGDGSLSPLTKSCIQDMAGREGIVLDPTYTGKTFRAMLDELDGGALTSYKNPLYIHTGGIFGLMARSDEFQP